MSLDEATLRMEFEGELWYWRGPAPFHFITVPDEGWVALRAMSPVVSYGWGMITVTVRIGRTVWATSLFPKDGRYVVPVKDVVRKAEGLAVGDSAALELSIRS